MAGKLTYIRDLGIQEWYLRERTVTKMYHHFLVSCRFNLPIEDNLLFEILRSLVLEHPTLACNVANVSDKGRIEMHLTNQLKFRDVVIHNDLFDEVTSEVLKYLDTHIRFDPTNPDLPLFKIVVLKGNLDFVLVLDHSLFDGESATSFWKLFYEKLVGINSNEISSSIDLEKALLFNIDEDLHIVKEKKFSPRAEDIYNIQPDLLFNMSKSIKPYLPESLQYYLLDGDHAKSPAGYTQWHGPKYPSFDQFKDFQFEILNIKPDSINKVLQKCRSEKVALSSYINFCLMNSFVNNGNPLGLDLDKHYVRLPNPIGCRRFCTENNKKEFDCNFGNLFYMGLAASHIPAKQLKSFSWDDVREMDISLKNAVNDPRLLMNLGWSMRNVHTLEDMDKHAVSPMKTFRSDNLRQSNLGFVKFPNNDKTTGDNSKWEVENMVFVQNVNAGTYIILNSVSTSKGGMNIGISYIDDGAIEDIPKVLQGFEENILKFLDV